MCIRGFVANLIVEYQPLAKYLGFQEDGLQEDEFQEDGPQEDGVLVEGFNGDGEAGSWRGH